jgi:hypothetical protein
MKKLLTLVLLLLSGSTFARQWTVSNTSIIPAQFTTIQAAVNACTNGDTILIAGSNTSYDTDLRISKSVVVIGNGAFTNGYIISSKVGVIYLDSTSNTAQADGSRITGLQINNLIALNGVQNVIIDRNKISTIELQAFSPNYGDYNPNRDFKIFNNFINNLNAPYSFETQFSTCPGLQLFNNIFEGQIEFLSEINMFNNTLLNSRVIIKRSQISNNIFNYGTGVDGFTSESQFENNIFFNTNTLQIPFNANSGYGNIYNLDPLFTNGNPGAIPFDLNINYGIPNASPAKNAGTDGTDIGFTGGQATFRWLNAPYANILVRQSPIPAITQLYVSGQTPNTSIFNVQLKAKKRD